MKAAADRLAAQATQAIGAIVPRLSPAQKAAFVRARTRTTLSQLAAEGWLTADQAATLVDLAPAL